MRVYRLCKTEYSDDLSGTGARKAGGRWNNKGVSVLYTAMSRSLCTAELAVHLPLGLLPDGFVMICIDIPDDIRILEVKTGDLPAGWRSFPYISDTQNLGDRFVKESEMAVMKVPSAVIPGEFNYLINPFHKDSGKISIMETEPFTFDERLFRR